MKVIKFSDEGVFGSKIRIDENSRLDFIEFVHGHNLRVVRSFDCGAEGCRLEPKSDHLLNKNLTCSECGSVIYWRFKGYSEASRKGSCQFIVKNVHELINGIEDSACPGKVWLGKLTAHNMTLMSYLGRKTSTRSKIIIQL